MTFCVRLEDIDDTSEGLALVGGKARSLRRLAAHGLPVPPALVVTSRLHRALRSSGPMPVAPTDDATLAAALAAADALQSAPWPAEADAELARGVADLARGPGARFSVRSSATLEDRADALGAGIFLSRTDVPAPDVEAAVRAVLASATEPSALAYAARRGLPADALDMAVLVHPYTRGDASGTAAFDADAQSAPVVEIERGVLSAAARARIADTARALAAREGAVEIEWVATGEAVTFLQLRPYRAPQRHPWHAAQLAPLDGAAWSWDAAHNPLPLSPAQAGLVALVDARCRTAFRQRVVGGYLFFAPTGAVGPARQSADEAMREATRTAEQRLAALGPEASLEDALEAFVATYEPLYGVVQPAARAARDALLAYLTAHGRAGTIADLLRGVPSLATERARRAAAIAASANPDEHAAAIAAYVALFGDEAPAWDVATPTWAEDPAALDRLARAAVAAHAPAAGEPPELDVPAEARAQGRVLVAAARAAAAVAEDDDVLYARVQARVRRALLREGRRLQAANLLARAEDVFWLPLESVRRDARGQEALTLAGVTHAVAEARDAHAAALADPPPLAGARSGWDTRAGGVRGRPASGGRAIGAVHLHVPGGAPVPAGAILVARTLLPTELPLVAPAALVVESGGTLGHVAAQARERGLPAVVDAAGAATAFRQGDRVLVDGDAGVVIRLGD